MDAMEHKYDPHMWTKPQTSNIVFPGVVRLSHCLGALKCMNEVCPRLMNYGTANTCHFKGYLLKAPVPGELCEIGGKTVRCHYCSEIALCVANCDCTLYYVMPSDEISTRLMIHRGFHLHDVRSGTSKALMDKTKTMVRNILAVDPHAGTRKVQMCVAREMFQPHYSDLVPRTIGWGNKNCLQWWLKS